MKAWCAKVLSSATTVDEALLDAHGADAIIALGVAAAVALGAAAVARAGGKQRFP